MLLIKDCCDIFPKTYMSDRFDSHLLFCNNNLYLYIKNGILKISINDQPEMNYYHFHNKFLTYEKKPLIVNSHFFHIGTFNNNEIDKDTMYLLKTDYTLNNIWYKSLGRNDSFHRFISTESGHIYISSYLRHTESGRLRCFDSEGNELWDQIKESRKLDVEIGCALLDDRILLPIQHDYSITSFDIINSKGDTVESYDTYPQNKHCYRKNSISIHKDKNKNILILTQNPAQPPLFTPDTIFMILSPFGECLKIMHKELFVDNIHYYDLSKTVFCSCEYTHPFTSFIRYFDCFSNEERCLFAMPGWTTGMKIVFYKENYYLFSNSSNYTNNQSIFVFDQYFRLQYIHPTGLEYAVDMIIVNDHIFILTQEKLKIFNIITGSGRMADVVV